MTHLDSIPPSVPKSIHRVHDFGNWSHLGKLIDELNKLLAANGALNGWYVHDRILLVAFLLRSDIWYIGKPICWRNHLFSMDTIRVK